MSEFENSNAHAALDRAGAAPHSSLTVRILDLISQSKIRETQAVARCASAVAAVKTRFAAIGMVDAVAVAAECEVVVRTAGYGEALPKLKPWPDCDYRGFPSGGVAKTQPLSDKDQREKFTFTSLGPMDAAKNLAERRAREAMLPEPTYKMLGRFGGEYVQISAWEAEMVRRYVYVVATRRPTLTAWRRRDDVLVVVGANRDWLFRESMDMAWGTTAGSADGVACHDQSCPFCFKQ